MEKTEMQTYNVLIAYDLNSNKTDNDAWAKFKEKYSKYLESKSNYPQSTAILRVSASSEEAAISTVINAIKEWRDNLRKSGTNISISKFLVSVCGYHKLYI